MKKSSKTLFALILIMSAFLISGCQQPAGFLNNQTKKPVNEFDSITGKLFSYTGDWGSEYLVIKKDSSNDYHFFYGGSGSSQQEADNFLNNMTYADNTSATIGKIVAVKKALYAPKGGYMILIQSDKHFNYGDSQNHTGCFIPAWLSFENDKVYFSSYYSNGTSDFSTEQDGLNNMEYSDTIYAYYSTLTSAAN